ncbi:hypothetical protein THOB06_90083 [Vibrio rotiferianus]|nr:hypothetical protein THOG10_90083 [Vibrio rotiferianus]CAH1596927.1 hypothetical protein THOB06_90083 [Vibrio rotiferianus]
MLEMKKKRTMQALAQSMSTAQNQRLLLSSLFYNPAYILVPILILNFKIRESSKIRFLSSPLHNMYLFQYSVLGNIKKPQA